MHEFFDKIDSWIVVLKLNESVYLEMKMNQMKIEKFLNALFSSKRKNSFEIFPNRNFLEIEKKYFVNDWDQMYTIKTIDTCYR